MLEETNNEEYFKDIENSLNTKRKSSSKKKLLFILFLVLLNIIISGVVVYIFISLLKNLNKKEVKKNFTILFTDNDFLKPNIKLNAEFELIKMKNGMIGLLINDPYSNIFHVQFEVGNGQLMDTVPGLAHLDEHMIFGGGEKYSNFSFIRNFGGNKGFIFNGYTNQINQVYFSSVSYNFKYEKVIDIFLDGFKYPLYNEKVIYKEIQAINLEFYLNYRNRYYLLEALVRMLSSNKTSFNGIGIGNNETLNPNETMSFSKKLKGYHMLVNKPENIFFALYSNLTINALEEYIEKNFNYEMHEFTKNEIDIDDKNKLEENIKNLKQREIFDESLYEHGFYYNSDTKGNILNIFIHIGNIDYKDLQFDIMDYYEYLLNSKSLYKLLIKNDYITISNKINVIEYLVFENNNVVLLEMTLTNKGVKELENVLLIIFKYIEIMKKEGYKKEFFINFIKYKQTLEINKFEKSSIVSGISEYISQLIQNYNLYGSDKIFTRGAQKEDIYDENKLKNYLNRLKFEKSFFAINIASNATQSDNILESKTIKTLKYYNLDFLYGKIPTKLKNEINSYKIIDNLYIREINLYFSGKYQKDIPCYKKTPNKCKELNEFDFEREDRYNATLLEEKNRNYKTYYQIDKSSEAFIVSSYLEMEVLPNDLFNKMLYNNIEYSYVKHKLSNFNELPSISISNFFNNSISFEINSFSDNTEKIFIDFIKCLKEEPKEEDFKNIIKDLKSQYNYDVMPLNQYTNIVGQRFINKGEGYDMNINESIHQLDSINFTDFKKINNEIFSNITSITLKIVGNIDKNLVQNIHNTIKENIKIQSQNIKASKIRKLESNTPSSFVYNFYQKSNTSIDNSVLVIYNINNNTYYSKYINVLQGCLLKIGMTSLRFNYTNAYSPSIMVLPDRISIYEQGRYKEITQMEDDINEVILGMINGNIQCENYEDIIKSYKLKSSNKIEKTYKTLFRDFVDVKLGYNNDSDDIEFPANFTQLMEKIAPIFIEPQRYTILIGRKDISDEDFKKMVENRKNNANYIINKNITIEHTEKIDYLKNRK